MNSKARPVLARAKRSAKVPQTPRFDGRVEELEPRILFSADAAAVMAILPGDVTSPALTCVQASQPMSAAMASTSITHKEVVFVDASVPDAQQLINLLRQQADGSRTLNIYWMDAHSDGVKQISEVLATLQDVDAVHILSHGSNANLQLGNASLNAQTIQQYASQLTSWHQALNKGADLMLYGCDVAQDMSGRQFVDDLQLLTGADVAASSDLTGSSSLGGNWTLEYQDGQIQAKTALTMADQQAWQGILATITFQQGDANAYAGTLDTYIQAGSPNSAAGGTATQIVGGKTTVNQQLFQFGNIFGSGANQVPLGSTITSATLTLDGYGSDPGENYELHKMLISWDESSTWNSLSSGVSTNNTDASSTVDATFTNTGGTNALNVTTDVQAWSSGGSNYGWVITGVGNNATNAGWYSSEYATLASRPILSVTYTLNPPALDLDANNSSGAAGVNFTQSWTENGGAKVVADSDASLTDAGSTTLTSLTATITNLQNGASESLAATTTGTSIVATYNSGTGVLALSGTDTTAHYQQVLRTITYDNSSNNPNTTARSITFVANDGTGSGNSATATTTLSITAVNDAPTITSNGGAATASVNVKETLTAVTTVTATDPDSPTLTYSISGGADASKFSINSTTGVLTFVSAPDYEAPTDVGANNVYDVTVQVSDGSLTDTQAIAVAVTDVSSTLVVTTTADTNDSGLGTAFTAEQLNAINGGTDGKVSLREALIAANNTAGTDTISFALTGATGSYGEYTITATSALPTITQAVNIDASTQSGYVAGGLHTVVLDGNDAAAYGLDLTNTADGSTVRGLVIRNFTSYGIYVESGSDNNTIAGNFIGSFNADGSNKGVGFGNATAGIFSYGANTVIGGTTAADRNVISGNPGGYNIYLVTGANGTVIQGNYIGLNAAGTSVFSTTNPNYGIMIETSATNVTIGGTASGAGNVISGHVREGIWVTTTGTVTIQGNYIGTDATGTVDLGNTRYGIYLDDGGTALIGGSTAGAGNLISGNDLGGIYAANAGVTVQGNIIGLNATGTAKLANSGSGIELRTTAASTIGGNGSGYRNIISGNTAYGIDVETSYAHVIKGNYIGVGADGVTLLGNTLAGVYINATGTIVGGKTSGDGNIVAGNGGAGIAVAGGNGNLFYRNSIYGNTGLGIDLGNDGVTLNDYNDGDGGPNYQNNYPVITSVVTNGTSTTITGSIDWAQGPDTLYIELFSSPSKDATGYGQGKTYLGAAQVTTVAGTGDATFSLTVTGVSVGEWISAVANIETSYIGASEFSKAVQAVAPANAPRGRVIWNNNDRFYQSYADWSAAGFGGIGTDGLNFGDDISMIAAAEAPTRNEILFIGSADASGKILAGIWNGSTWSSVLSIPVASPSASAQNYDSFAVAYDAISGDAMIVWDNGNTGTTGLSYATWNGTSWSAINTITAPVSGEPLHMKLAAKPNGHEMMLVAQNNSASNNQYAIVWNGSSWGNAQTLGTNTNEQYFELNVAYEQQSGKAMVIYDNSASNSPNVQYRTWNGSAWSSEGTITAPAGVTATSDLYNTAIASAPGSNRIAIAAKDAANETWLAVWDGSSWGSTLLATTSGVDTPDHHATMAVAFESQSGDLLAVYGKSAGPNVYYRTWTSGGGWSAETAGPSVGGTDIPYISKLYSDPYSNTIMLGVQDNAYDLNFVAWDGSAWGTVTELDNNTVFYYRENFTYVWFQNAPVIANLSGDTLAFTEDQSAQVIDQGTAATVTLSDETSYNGGNLTVSFVTGSTSTEDVLAIRNQGTGAGQIGVGGGNVTYGGTIIGSYTGGSNGASLVITLNGNASNVAVSALVKNITYQNTNTAAPSTTTRTVRFVATNALGQASANNDVTVAVTAVNDAPTNTVPSAQSTNEDTAKVFSSGNGNQIAITDVDAGTSTMQVTLTVTNGTLTLSGIAGLSFTAGDGTADTTMTFTGTASAINAALNGLTYSPTANFNGASSLTILTSDLGNSGTGGALTATDVVSITVNAVNDAPVGTSTAVTALEDTAYTFTTADFGFTDPSDSPANTLLAVKIATVPGAGSLTLNGVAVTAGQFVTAADIVAGLLKFTPAANANGTGYTSFTFQVQDNGGTANGGVDLDTVARTMTVNVTAVNDAPVGTSKTVTTNEDTAYTFTTADFGFTDPSDSPANTLQAVKITTVPGTGSLTLNGVAVTAGQFVSAANITSGLLKFTPAANANGAGYASFTFQVQDNGGTANGGVDLDASARTMTVNVTSVNDAPVGTSKTVTTNEDTAYTFTTADFGFTDPSDSPANTLQAVKITTVPGAGSLTLNGVAVTNGQFITAADIVSGLLKFTPAANANGTGYASFTFQVQDNGGTANGGVDLDTVARTMTVNVTAVNDAPVGTSKTVTTNEDTAYTFTAADFGFTDPNDSPANTLLAVKITTVPGTGSLTLNGLAVSAGDFITAADIVSGLLKFTPAANANGTGYASFTFQVQDNGGTANGGVDLDTVARTMTVNVTAVNDAPVGTSKTVTTNEDTAYTFTTADFGFTDPSDSPANTLQAVKITTVPGTGSLTLNGVAVTAGQFVSAANITSGLLKFTPAANANGAGYASFTLQVQDNGGTANGGVDLDASARTMTVNVTSVNDAPVGTSKTVTTNEDTAYTFTTADFGFTDPSDSPANTLQAVKITTVPGAGSLTLNGVAVTNGQFITAADIVSGLLKFTPSANANGTGYASFTFQVQDNGGTANGGVDLDTVARTMTVNVTAVNDAPVGTNKTVTTNEDTAYTFTAADFGFTDPNDSPANTLLAVKITTVPGTGSLTLNGLAVSAGDFITAADIVSGLLKFTPAANANGTGYASFTFQVQDNGGTANGGVDLDTVARTMTVNVTAVNDAPVGTSKTVTTNEDTAYTFTTADFGFTDPSDSPANTLQAVKITTVPGTGSLTLNGLAVTNGQFITAADIVSGLLKFTPAANGNGAGYTSFTFQVQDNGGTANGGVDVDTVARTMTVNVTAVNDAPSGTSRSVTTLENNNYTFSAADFGFTDANDTPANNLLAVKITTAPAAGSLTLNGVAVNAGDFVLASDIIAGKLVFTPALNANGTNYASLTFQVQDDGGTANGGVDLDPTPRTLNINVTQALNTAPQGADKTLTGLEDTPYVFNTADFGFTDPSSSPPDNLLAVKISTLPTQGTLALNGMAVNAGDFILASDIAANRLTYTGAANAHGVGYASFSFQVQDDGGTAGGGVDLDPVARTITMDITEVNDAPVGTDKTVTMLEESAYTFSASDFGFTDPNDGPANAWTAVKITTVPGAGSLTLNGVAVINGQLVSAADINAGKLSFASAPNGNGAGYASFTFQVQDDGGTANGGVDLDTTARTLTVNVTPVNDAPAGTSHTVSTNEDTGYTFGTADFGFTDTSDAPANTLLAVKITSTPGAGGLTLNGVAVNTGDLIQASDIVAGKLVFTPAANANGTGYASFTFQVQDNGGTANGGVDMDLTPRTMTVDVTPVNDAPVGTDHTVTASEDTTYTFATSDFGFTDPSDVPANALLAVKITTTPGAGTLALNGVAVTNGQFVSAADIASGLLQFTPVADANGNGYASFTFQVQDDGGTANGGANLDAIARTMTIDVSSVNDAPVGTDQTVTTNEDTAYVFSATDFGFADPKDAPANTLQAVKISTIPGAGTLTLNGVVVNAGDVVQAIDIAAGKLRFTPAADANGTGYASFTFQVQDNGGTANGGVNMDLTPRTMTVNVTAVNDAPVGTDHTVTTNEDTAYTFSTADFGFTDPHDAPTNALLAVKITTVPGAGTFTLNGVAVTNGQFVSAADIASGLLRFTPTANANGNGYASFTFQVQDDGGTANGGADLDASARTMTVNVTAVNDAPVGTSKTVTINEDTGYTFSTADFGFTDPNDAPANTLQAVKITTTPGAGTLTLNGVGVNAGDLVQALDIAAGKLVFTPAANANGAGYTSFSFQVQDNGGTANGGINLDATPRTMTLDVTAINDAPAGVSTTITAQEDTAYTFGTADFGFNDPNDAPSNTLLAVKLTTLPLNGSLTLNGVAVSTGQFVSAADVVAGLLQFTPATNAHGTGYTSFTFQVQDNGGTANGGVDLDPTPRTLTIDVTAINDAPVGTDHTVTTNEDTAYTFSTADFGFTDPSDSPADALQAVKITTMPANGSLTLNGVAVSAGQFISAGNITSGLLKFTPAANLNGAGYASFTFQVQDNGGTANGGIDLDTTPRTMTVDIAPVNDAPVGTNHTVTTNEDTAYTFSAADFGFTDPQDAPANTLLAVKITTIPGAGSLTLNGVAITNGQFISAADIASGLLQFTPSANAHGTGYASFTFQVQDNGGTANGGIDTDPTPRTMTMDVTPVNDAPVGTDHAITTNEDTAYTFTTADFGFTDTSDAPANALLAVKISTLPSNGSLSLNGGAVTTGQFISAADIASGLLTFMPALHANGAGYASFSFQVQDNGGTLNGGVDLDVTPRTMTVNVMAVNDAPVGTDHTVSTNEDTAYTFVTSDFGFSDPHDTPANALLNIKISTLPTNGSLLLNGVAVTAGQFVSAANIASGLLKFTPAANANGAGYASFTFQVQDNGGTANGGVDLDASAHTMTVNVTSVNDAPVGTSKTVTTNEDTAYTFTTGDFGFTDPSDSPANTLQAVKITTVPGAGSLTLNGVAVTNGQFITAADIVSGLLKFTPAANANGTGYASFTFQVQDNGGTANGGVDLDTVARTMTVNVTAVNDAPVGTSKTVTTNEDTAYTFTTADFGFTDPNDSPANTLQAVKITTVPGAGSLTLNGLAVSAGDFITAADIVSGLLKFTPAANANGTGYASFTFQVQDTGGTTNGGVDLDASARTMTVNVTPVVDPSVAVLPAAGYDAVEQTSVTLNGTGMSVASIDAAGGTIQVKLSVGSGSLSASAGSTGVVVAGVGTNQLTLTGSQVQINALLDGLQGATLSYLNPLDAPPATDTLTLSITEGGITTASTQTNVRIAAVNDNPVMGAATLNASTNSSTVSWASSTLLSGAVDPDGDALTARVVQGPQHGTLSINGNGQLTYTAASGYTGSDSFSYEAFDGQVASSNTRVMNVDITSSQPVAIPAPVSTAPTTEATTPPVSAPSTSSSPPVDKPATPDAPRTAEASASPTAATPPQKAEQSAETAAPTAALHERIRPGIGFGAGNADNNSGSPARQIDLTRIGDYFTPSWSNAGNNASVTQLLELIKPTLERVPDINLMITPLSSVSHALPAQASQQAGPGSHDDAPGQALRLTKVATYSTGLGLSIGTIWWTARISGLVTSALISTPAWRSLDPLPVVTSPSDDPDHDEDGDSRLGDREVEHLFDGDKPIEQDMPLIQ